MPRLKPATKIVSRKQWRLLKMYLDDLGEAETATWCEYTKTELLALLAVDYDSLPERTGVDAPARDKKGLAQVACACGCGTLFTSKGGYHKYAAPSHRVKKVKEASPQPKPSRWRRRFWIPELQMMILVDEAMDRYETRALIGA